MAEALRRLASLGFTLGMPRKNLRKVQKRRNIIAEKTLIEGKNLRDQKRDEHEKANIVHNRRGDLRYSSLHAGNTGNAHTAARKSG